MASQEIELKLRVEPQHLPRFRNSPALAGSAGRPAAKNLESVYYDTEDLRLRGAGEVLGTRQSGLPEFRMADLAVHGDLLAVARDDARLILERDPELQTERGKALRVLLYLFERDQAVKYLRSG